MQLTTLVRRFALMSLILGALAGCQTVEGLGQDIEHAGDHIEDATDN